MMDDDCVFCGVPASVYNGYGEPCCWDCAPSIEEKLEQVEELRRAQERELRELKGSLSAGEPNG